MEQQVNFPELDQMKATRKSPVYRPKKKKLREINSTACGVVCATYMATAAFLALRLDIAERWLQLLLIIVFVMLAGTMFGIAASVGVKEE